MLVSVPFERIGIQIAVVRYRSSLGMSVWSLPRAGHVQASGVAVIVINETSLGVEQVGFGTSGAGGLKGVEAVRSWVLGRKSRAEDEELSTEKGP
jgi:hypothetical protein